MHTRSGFERRLPALLILPALLALTGCGGGGSDTGGGHITRVLRGRLAWSATFGTMQNQAVRLQSQQPGSATMTTVATGTVDTANGTYQFNDPPQGALLYVVAQGTTSRAAGQTAILAAPVGSAVGRGLDVQERVVDLGIVTTVTAECMAQMVQGGQTPTSLTPTILHNLEYGAAQIAASVNLANPQSILDAATAVREASNNGASGVGSATGTIR